MVISRNWSRESMIVTTTAAETRTTNDVNLLSARVARTRTFPAAHIASSVEKRAISKTGAQKTRSRWS